MKFINPQYNVTVFNIFRVLKLMMPKFATLSIYITVLPLLSSLNCVSVTKSDRISFGHKILGPVPVAARSKA